MILASDAYESTFWQKEDINQALVPRAHVSG